MEHAATKAGATGGIIVTILHVVGLVVHGVWYTVRFRGRNPYESLWPPHMRLSLTATECLTLTLIMGKLLLLTVDHESHFPDQIAHPVPRRESLMTTLGIQRY